MLNGNEILYGSIGCPIINIWRDKIFLVGISFLYQNLIGLYSVVALYNIIFLAQLYFISEVSILKQRQLIKK